MSLRIAIDVGGTFTDGVLLDEPTGRIWLAKCLTTYGDPGDAIAAVTADLLAQHGSGAEVTQLVHGTTLITNSLIERKGVRTALLTNQGMADILDIRRELRYDTYDLALRYPKPLVDGADRHQITARLGPDGSEWAPLDEREARTVLARIAESGAQALAICLLHAPVSDRHERALGRIAAEIAPDLPVSLSSEVSGEIGEYERMSTTTANAFVQPLVQTYLDRLQNRFAAAGISAPLDVMVSDGAFTTAKQAARFPIRLLESGPAGGVLSAINCAMAHDARHVLAFDMGGTTAKSCVAIDGQPDITHAFEFAREKRFKKGSGLPALTPSIDLIEIGAGGGSLARQNALGLLQVGPESAGSEPGPACYSLGGDQATVTDADLLLGYLDANGFLGGAMTLSLENAQQALALAGAPLGLDAVATARGVHEIVNENMAAAARTHIAEKGLDARSFVLVATGGAGPVHAVDVARRLRIRRVLCPIASGVGSCLGFLAAPARAERTWSRVERIETIDRAALADRLALARSEIEAELRAGGAALDQAHWDGMLEARYTGQGSRVDVPFDPLDPPDAVTLRAAFLKAYTDIFSRPVPGGIPEAVTWRLRASVGDGVRRFQMGISVSDQDETQTRRLFVGDGFVEVPVHRRASLAHGMSLRAPCVITETESTLVVAQNADVTVLDDGTIEVLLDEDGP